MNKEKFTLTLTLNLPFDVNIEQCFPCVIKTEKVDNELLVIVNHLNLETKQEEVH